MQHNKKVVFHCCGYVEDLSNGYNCGSAFSMKTTNNQYTIHGTRLESELAGLEQNAMANAYYKAQRKSDFTAFDLSFKEALICCERGEVDVEIISNSSYVVNTISGKFTCIDRQLEFMNFWNDSRKKKIKITHVKQDLKDGFSDSEMQNVYLLAKKIANFE